jgi:Cu/Ag efflux protein CusF
MTTVIVAGAGRAAMLLAVCLLLGSCKPAPPLHRYPMHGEVLALDAQNHTATIKHGKIGDWMGAMTMEYPIKSEADWKKLAPGAQIDATVFVSDAGYYVGDVRVAAGSAPPHR